jgi:stage IV sporulation protein A
LKKPFVILLNCKDIAQASGLRNTLESKYEAPVVALNVEKMEAQEILFLLQKVLFEFPVLRIDVKTPKWLRSLSCDNRTVASLLEKIKSATVKMERMRDCFALEKLFGEEDDFLNPEEIYMDLATGRVELTIDVKPSLFYQVLSEECGEIIPDDLALMRYMMEVSSSKNTFDKVQYALQEADEKGYGIVYPAEEEYALQKPRLVKKSAGYGVQFKATAKSYHIVRVEVGGEVTPIIGTKEQGEEFVSDSLRAYEEGAEKVWETNIFGKSLRSLVADELSKKADDMPMELRKKLRRAATRIVNDGKGNLICIVF